jgi:hypothetical protein
MNMRPHRKPLITVVQAGGVLVLLSLAVNTIGISPDIALLEVNYIHMLLLSLRYMKFVIRPCGSC